MLNTAKHRQRAASEMNESGLTEVSQQAEYLMSNQDAECPDGRVAEVVFKVECGSFALLWQTEVASRCRNKRFLAVDQCCVAVVQMMRKPPAVVRSQQG